jgi:hypothetical protein
MLLHPEMVYILTGMNLQEMVGFKRYIMLVSQADIDLVPMCNLLNYMEDAKYKQPQALRKSSL